MHSISTIILSYNEERHIERCVKNAQRFSQDVYLVDSYSTDRTLAIAKSLGAKVFQNTWENNHAKQFNWGLDNLPIETEWVFRLDADEYLSDELIQEIDQKLPGLSPNVSGIAFERKMCFLDTIIAKGWLQMTPLRMFRLNHGFCEDRWMDEHLVLNQGKSTRFDGYFVDHNLNPLGWWIQKHNNYSIREAIELLDVEYQLLPPKTGQAKHYELSEDTRSKREKKKKYIAMPLFWRSFLYFIYRYVFKLGFIQGKEGFLWHFLQGWWYRTVVDAKIYEIKKACGDDTDKMKRFIEDNYQIKL